MLFRKFRLRQGMNALALGDYAKAEQIFRRLLEEGRDEQGIRHNIAVCLTAQKRFSEAEPFFLEELEHYGACFSRHVALGDMYYLWGKRRQSLRFYTLSLQDSPSVQFTNLLKTRIAICRDEDDFAQTRESLELFQKGQQQKERGRYDEALESFKLSLKKDPSQYQGLNETGVILMNHKNKPDEALPYFKKALQFSNLSLIRKNAELAQKRMQSE